jgi:septum formation protein
LLTWAGVDVEVRPADIDEARRPEEDPVLYAERLARTKADTAPEGVVCVAADTVVHVGGEVLDKPVDRVEASAHLRRLSGRWHTVTTGVCVRAGAWSKLFSTSTSVRFRALSEAEIAGYVASGEADDKAGAYGIQGRAGSFVAELQGSWTNVMGLPMEATLAALREAGVETP